MYENDEWQSRNVLKIAIQTIDKCNNKCLMCPSSYIYRTSKKMSDDLFKKIIKELIVYMKTKNINKIKFDMFLQNEPLLDNELFEKIRFIKAVLPAKVEISTNGLLVPKYEKALVKWADYVFFNIMGWHAESYSVFHGVKINQSFYDKMMNSIKRVKSQFVPERAVIALYKRELAGNLQEAEKWYKRDYSRAGFLSNDKIYHDKIWGCYYNKHKFWNFLADGSMILCYQDWRRYTIYGNIKYQSLLEIENSSLYKTYINKVEGKIKSENDFICKKCELSYGDKKYSSTSDKWQPEIFKSYN